MEGRPTTTADVVTVHLEPGQRDALAALAAEAGSDLDRVLADAVEHHLALRRWQAARIEEGLRQSEAGEFADDAEVEAAYARWR